MSDELYKALKDINDMGLVRLRERHKRDPLWCDMKFGSWLEVECSFREQRGHARGFRQGVKAGLARAEGAAPPISVRTLALVWSGLVPALAAVNTLLLLLSVRLVEQENMMWLIVVMVILPATVVAQATGAGFLWARLYNYLLKRPDDGHVIVIKIPEDSVDKDSGEHSLWDEEQTKNAISNGEFSKRD